ncbi:MAG TPA: prepilin-type N-terminal cleavage/methylation domain-containing protein [Gammaproteobacteria bacterium]|nr:prepilin-type N-terminal cleavage/methylation domain-containing protein [Gammaproteobacteria bacterium]
MKSFLLVPRQAAGNKINLDCPRGVKPRGQPKGESCATPTWASPIALSRGKLRGIYFKGFSLIELMIVVSIISILAMLAIPSYQVYIQRARFAEVITMTEVFKMAVSLALQQGIPSSELVNGKYDIPNDPKSTHNLSSIHVENGIITATGTALVNHASYILKPNSDGTIWTISGTCLKNGLCHE